MIICTWCGWDDVSCCFFLRWPRDFRSAIKDGKRQCQVRAWNRFPSDSEGSERGRCSIEVNKESYKDAEGRVYNNKRGENSDILFLGAKRRRSTHGI